MALRAGEDEVAAGGDKVHLQEASEESRQGDGARGGGSLGWPQPESMLRFMEGAGVGADGDGPAVQVDMIALQAGQLAPAAAGPSRGDHQ